MKNNLRQSMSWLHTWSGLWASWILFTIFFTGTLSVFNEAITQWMEPEQQPSTPSIETTAERAQAVRFAQQYLEKNVPTSHFWSIDLPDEEDATLRIFWEDKNEQFQKGMLNPRTGEFIAETPVRETEGGNHFIRMHYELHAGIAGIWIVGFFAMAMLVGLISGVIIHKRIFKDFFTFRPGKNQRSWLDIHNVSGVLTLPFQLMITYTGLAIFFSTYMPAAISANYQETDDFFNDLFSQPEHREETHIGAAVTALDSLLIDAENKLQRKVSFVVVEHPGDSSAVATVFGPFNEGDNENMLVSPDGGSMVYDAVTGEIRDTVLPRSERGGPIWMVQQAMAELHMATFGDYAVKWLYFVCGLAGSALIATGSILFMAKRRKRSAQEFGVRTQRIYSIIDSLNVAAIAGLMLACAAYFWVNRLLPVSLEDRASREIQLFFIIWLSTFIHAGFRPARTAWIEQFLTSALLCIALPLLNFFTTNSSFIHYWRESDWLRLGTELSIFGVGLLLVFGAWRIKKSPVVKQSNTALTAKQNATLIVGESLR